MLFCCQQFNVEGNAVADALDRILTQWQRERPDLDLFPMGLLGRYNRLGAILGKRIHDPFAEFGLRPGEPDVLLTLRRAGTPYELTPGELSRSLMVTAGAVTNRVDRLVAKELVTRRHDPDNRRSVLVGLNPAGRTLVDKVLPQHVANETELLSPLSDTEQRQLNRLLAKLLAGHEG